MANALSTTDDHLYEQMAGKIHQLIEHGTLRPGDRVPSVRKLSEQHDVSIATVLQAYMLLEDKGLIEARPQSGYYVRPLFREIVAEPAKTEPPSAACCVNICNLAMQVLRTFGDPSVVPLGAGTASPELFPSVKLHRVLASVARRSGAAANRYEQPAGTIELRRQIARRSSGFPDSSEEAPCSRSRRAVVPSSSSSPGTHSCLRPAIRGPEPRGGRGIPHGNRQV